MFVKTTEMDDFLYAPFENRDDFSDYGDNTDERIVSDNVEIRNEKSAESDEDISCSVEENIDECRERGGDYYYTWEELEELEADAFGEECEHYNNPYGCSWLDIM